MSVFAIHSPWTLVMRRCHNSHMNSSYPRERTVSVLSSLESHTSPWKCLSHLSISRPSLSPITFDVWVSNQVGARVPIVQPRKPTPSSRGGDLFVTSANLGSQTSHRRSLASSYSPGMTRIMKAPATPKPIQQIFLTVHTNGRTHRNR